MGRLLFQTATHEYAMNVLTDEQIRRRRAIIITVIVISVVALFIWQVNRLRPPSSMTIATGPEDEHEYKTAQLYQRYMAAEGVELEIVSTAGSLETMALIQAGEVDAGFILNAANLGADDAGLMALASVGHIPIWVFYRAELETDGPLTDLADLRGLRVAFGAPESGDRAVSKILLNTAQISEDEFRVVSAPLRQSSEMLLNGKIDALLTVTGLTSETVRELMLSPETEVMGFRLADTYERLIPFLHVVDLLEGSFNIAERDPPTDKPLLTDASVLISGEELHPDLQVLLLLAATNSHDQGVDFFPTDEVFPDVEDLTLPVSPTTKQFITEGQTALQRYLPFWVASPVERFYLLILPALLLLYPLLRNTPTAYGTFMRRRVFVWYKQIREVEQGLDQYSIAELDAHITELEALEQELTETISVSTGYLQTFYNLRVHIHLVTERLRARRADLDARGLARNEKPSAELAQSTPAIDANGV